MIMNKKRVKNVLINVFVRMRKPYYQGVAAELAFFFLMSMVPLFIITGELMGIFALPVDVIGRMLEEYISAEVVKSLTEYMDYTPSGTISALFILFALWSASKAQYSLIRIANYTYTGLNSGKGFFRERLRAMFTVIITIFLMAFGLAILVYGKPIMDVTSLYVEEILKVPLHFYEVWYILRWPLGIALYFFGITFINYILPSEKISLKQIIPGSVLTSAGMLVVTWVYSFYMSRFSNYDIFYGGLASVIGLLIWFYILGYVMVIGIVFNAALEETREEI